WGGRCWSIAPSHSSRITWIRHSLVRMFDGRVDIHGTVRKLCARGLLDGINDQVAEADEFDGEVDAVFPAIKQPRKLVEVEHREVGGVKWRIYKSYLKASSYFIWGCLASCVLTLQLLSVGEKLWIKVWGEA
ncbi:unnamed protein product, partial [Mycena citricolor]